MKANKIIQADPKSPLYKQILELLTKTGFGDGTHGKAAGNHAGVILDYTSNATANTADTLPHPLGRAPIHVWPTRPSDKQGASLQFVSADNQNLVLKCNVASASFKLYVE